MDNLDSDPKDHHDKLKEIIVTLETNDGIINIEKSIFDKFTDILSSPEMPNFITTNDHKWNINLKDTSTSINNIELIYKYMHAHNLDIKKERTPINIPISSNTHRILNGMNTDIQFFEPIQDNIELICELIYLAHILQCNTIHTKTVALYTRHIKIFLNVKTFDKCKYILDILRTKSMDIEA